MDNSFMDWTPTPFSRSPTPKSPAYRMPGAWPVSPSLKRTFSDLICDPETETPTAKRVCRRIYTVAASVANRIALYNIVRFIKNQRGQQRHQQSANRRILPLGSSHSARSNKSITNPSRVSSIIQTIANDNNLQAGDKAIRENVAIPIKDDVHVDATAKKDAMLPKNLRTTSDLEFDSRGSPGINHPQNMPATFLQSIVRPAKATSPPQKRKGTWDIIMAATTTQPRLPTPEPERQPSLKDVIEAYHKLENPPKLRPSMRYYFTPPYEIEELVPTCKGDTKTSQLDEDPPSRDFSPSPSAHQLANELQQVLCFADNVSQSGSDDFDICIPTPAPTPRKQNPDDAASISNTIPPPPYELTPPSIRERPLPKQDNRSVRQPSSPHIDPPTDLSKVASSHSQEATVTPCTPVPAAAYPREEVVPSIEITPHTEFRNLSLKDRTSDRDPPKAGFHSVERLRRLTRQQKLKAQALADKLNNYEIVPLTKEWDERVRDAVRKGNNKYSASDLARVVPQYASRGQDNWLNDEAINGYLDLITQHGKKNDRETQTPSFHAFNSFFYTNLSTKGPSSIARWSKRAKINNENLLNVQKVFVPINASAHWTLAVVDPQKKTITHYNSMRSATRGITVCEHVKQWVAMELKGSFKEQEWTIESVGESPQQSNSDDCGVFTITSARQIMLGYTPMSYRSEQIPTQRKRIVAELVNGGLLTSKQQP